MNVAEPILRHAHTRPDHPAIVMPSGGTTYRQLADMVEQAAGALAARGVQPGDVVGIQAPALRAHVVMTLAVARLGAVSLSLPISATAHAPAQELVALCGVKFIVFLKAPETPFVGDALVAQVSIAQLADAEHPAPALVHREPGDLWRIATSSGTTGRPKPIRFSHGAQLVKSSLFGVLVPAAPRERMLVAIGPAVMYATNYWVRALVAGTTLVGCNEKAAAALDAMHSSKATVVVTSPGNAIGMVSVARARGGDFAKAPAAMRALVLGGSAVHPAQHAAFREHLCQNVYINYGASEVGAVAFSDPRIREADSGCAGWIPPWIDVQALGEDGSVLPVGEPGLLRMRGAGMADGYILPPDEPASQAFRNGWFHSNDVGAVTEKGTIQLQGREGDVINLGGIKVDPARVEAVLAGDDSVADCAVFAARAPSGAEVLAAAVVGANVDPDALKRRCSNQLRAQFVPKHVFAVTALPRNDAGKLMRSELAKSFPLPVERT